MQSFSQTSHKLNYQSFLFTRYHCSVRMKSKCNSFCNCANKIYIVLYQIVKWQPVNLIKTDMYSQNSICWEWLTVIEKKKKFVTSTYCAHRPRKTQAKPKLIFVYEYCFKKLWDLCSLVYSYFVCDIFMHPTRSYCHEGHCVLLCVTRWIDSQNCGRRCQVELHVSEYLNRFSITKWNDNTLCAYLLSSLLQLVIGLRMLVIHYTWMYFFVVFFCMQCVRMCTCSYVCVCL